MENKYTGEVPLKIGDKKGTLVFDWAAISIVRSNTVPEDLDNLVAMNPAKLAIIAEAGFKKHNPEITAEWIIEQSPPILAVAEAVDRALLFALHGPEAAKEILQQIDKFNDELQKTQKKSKSKKKTK